MADLHRTVDSIMIVSVTSVGILLAWYDSIAKPTIY